MTRPLIMLTGHRHLSSQHGITALISNCAMARKNIMFQSVKVRWKCHHLLALLALLGSFIVDGQQKFPKTVLYGAGTRGPLSEINWESQKVLPPILKNPTLIPPDLRNKPPKVHVNYYPTEASTKRHLTTTPSRFYYPNLQNFYQARPNTVDFAKPSYNRRNDEKINLNTASKISFIVIFFFAGTCLAAASVSFLVVVTFIAVLMDAFARPMSWYR